MKKAFVILVAVVLLGGAGCQKKDSFAENFVLSDSGMENTPVDSVRSETATESSQSTAVPEINRKSSAENSPIQGGKTAFERGMIGIRILNAKTKQPIPASVLNVPYSSQQVKPNKDGYLEIPFSYKQVYVPKLESYFVTGHMETEGHFENKIWDILLIPEETPGNAPLEYVKGILTPNADLSTTISGKITKNGGPMVNLVIGGNYFSHQIKTDGDGKFKMLLIAPLGGARLYFPEVKNIKYYQIDPTPGYNTEVDIKL